MICISTHADAALKITFKQDGSNVVATTTGSIVFDGSSVIEPYWIGNLSQIGLFANYVNSLNFGYVDEAVKVYHFNGRGDMHFLNSITGGFIEATSSIGDPFGITVTSFGKELSKEQYISLPVNYASGMQLNNVTTWENKTLSDLYLTPGTSFGWKWWPDFTTDGLTISVDSTPTPVPAPLPILGAVAALGWSRKLRRRIKDAEKIA